MEARTSVVEPSTTSRTGRVAVWLLFAVYLVLLIWLVLFKLHLPFIGRDDMREIKLIPFAPTGGFGASSPLEVIGNTAVFIPFGVYLRMLVTWRPWAIVLVTAGASLACEVTQYVLALGSSDVTDVLVNAAGGLAGIALVNLLRRRFGASTAKIISRAAAIGTLIAFVAVGLQIASFPHLGPPHNGTVILQ